MIDIDPRAPRHGSAAWVPLRAIVGDERPIDMTTQAGFKRRVRERMTLTGERYAAARRVLLEQAQRRRGRSSRVWIAEPEVDDDTIRKATGREWNAWCDLIETRPGRTQGHTAIAQWLVGEHGVGAWWAQSVTVGYERITGIRLPHQMADGTFTAGKSRTITGDAAALRAMLLDTHAHADLFAGHAPTLKSKPASKAIRLAFSDGIAQFDLDAKEDGRVKVTVSHLKLPTYESVEQWKFYWGEWLEAIDSTG